MPASYHPHWNHTNQELVQAHADDEDKLVQLFVGRLACTDEVLKQIVEEIEKLYELSLSNNDWEANG